MDQRQLQHDVHTGSEVSADMFILLLNLLNLVKRQRNGDIQTEYITDDLTADDVCVSDEKKTKHKSIVLSHFAAQP